MNDFKQSDQVTATVETVDQKENPLRYRIPRTSDYLLIDQSSQEIDIGYQEKDLKKLLHGLESLHTWLSNQQIIQFPETLAHFHVIEVIHTIILNENSDFPPVHFLYALSCLNFIFQSDLMCQQYLNPDFFAHICSVLLKWPTFDSHISTDGSDLFFNTLGDYAQLLRFVISYDKHYISIYNTFPFELLFQIHESIPTIHIYSTVSISYFLYTYFDLIDLEDLLQNIPNIITFFTFVLFCFQHKVTKSFEYNLWTISGLISKLTINFPLRPFIEMHLNEFINQCIISKHESIVRLALYIIKQLHSPIKTVENVTNETLVNINGVQRYRIEPEFFNLENIMHIPKYSEVVKSFKTKTLALQTTESIFRYHPPIEVSIENILPHFDEMNIEMKTASVSLLICILENFDDDKLRGFIQNGLFTFDDGILNQFCEVLNSGKLVFEILTFIRNVIMRMGKYNEDTFLIVLLQDETFQELLNEITDEENVKNAQLAKELLQITEIEDVE